MTTSPRSPALTHAEVAELLEHVPETAGPGSAKGRQEWVYIDVRTPEEFATGHVPGAYNVPFQLGDRAGLHPNPDFTQVMAAIFPPQAALILGCRSGARAAAAERSLSESGYARMCVHLGSLVGARDAFGRTKAGWIEAGYPISEAALPGRTYDELRASGVGTMSKQPG